MGRPEREVNEVEVGSVLHDWGSELRAWRVLRGLSLRRLGALTSCSPSLLSKVERSERHPSRELAEACDEVLRTDGVLVRALVSVASEGGSHRDMFDGSTRAVSLAALADGPVTSGEWLSLPVRTTDGRVIFVSLPRRDLILKGLGLGAALTFTGATSPVIEPLSDRRVRQLLRGRDDVSAVEHFRRVRRHLIDSDNLIGPRHVIPAAQEQVNLIQQLRQSMRAADSRDLLHLQAEFAELLGWFNQDLGDFRAAQYWMKQALELAIMTGDSAMTTFILARRAQLAGDMGASLEAVDLGYAAQQQARPGSRLAVMGKTYGALGYALRNERDDSQRELDEARELLAKLDPDPDDPWGVWLDESYIEVHRGRCLTVAGRPHDAVEVYESALRHIPDGYHRDRGVYLARQGLAYASAGQPAQAAEVGISALTIGESTGSGRIVNELIQLDNALHKWRKVSEVGEFREAMNDVLPQQT